MKPIFPFASYSQENIYLQQIQVIFQQKINNQTNWGENPIAIRDNAVTTLQGEKRVSLETGAAFSSTSSANLFILSSGSYTI